MNITALTENTTERGLSTEHGLSLYIETNKATILFDMGQTSLFERNAALLQKDLTKVDIAVVSHGHYDHGGGLRRFLEINDRAPVYLHRCAFEPHYRADGTYNGLDVSLKNNSRLILTEGETSIEEGITLYDCQGRPKILELGSFGLLMQQEGTLVPDDFRHEQVLLIEEEGKRVLISGCSHQGIHNIMAWFRPDILIGGFHFFKMPVGDRLTELTRLLGVYSARYFTCHCTGVDQYHWMKRTLPDLEYLSTGKTIYL